MTKNNDAETGAKYARFRKQNVQIPQNNAQNTTTMM